MEQGAAARDLHQATKHTRRHVEAELAVAVPPSARSVRIALMASGPASLRLTGLTLDLGG